MNTDILSKDKDPMGAAILDNQTKGKAGKLSILSSMFEEDEMPVKHLFRNLEEMPILEQKALSLAKGKVLDVGAGAGCHALALQAQSIAVKAIDISPQSCQAILNETGFATPNNGNFALHFFIKDHLGNVRILADSKGNVEQAIDYYPFGSVIAESKNSERQPYLYNGKELDRMNGLDWYDYGARMYESDGLRWGQIDPRTEDTPEVSPYVYCNNNPIKASDPNGEKIIIWYKNRRGEDKAFIFTGFHRKNFISCPNNSFVIAFLKSYIYNARHGGGKNTIKAANAPNITVHLEDANTVTDRVDKYHNNGDGDHIVCWDPTTGLKLTNGGRQSATTKLEHEFDHAVDDITNHRAHRNAQKNDGSRYDNPEEKRVIEGSEAQTAKGNGEGVRHNHRGTKYPTISPTSIKEKK